MQKEITDFINKSRIATVCYINNGLPACFNCLYAFIDKPQSLVFKSSKSSQHSLALKPGATVAGTIYHTAKSGFDNIGVQFMGQVIADDQIYGIAEKAYYSKLPAALLMPGELFMVALDSIKFSHTVMGIKNKLNWQKALDNNL